ncbi:MAG TPA: hypothetical protein VGE02_11140 [Gemmatimonadales bacterium]
MATARPPASPLRGLVIRLVLSVVTLDAVAIALFYALGMTTADQRTRGVFVVAWTVATLLVCSYYLRRIRLHRRGWRVRE